MAVDVVTFGCRLNAFESEVIRREARLAGIDDTIVIDIPARSLTLSVPDATLATRRAAMEVKGDAAWQPAEPRQRQVSTALRAYAAMATSASRGAVRDVSQLQK